MTFSEALEHLKAGKRVSRASRGPLIGPGRYLIIENDCIENYNPIFSVYEGEEDIGDFFAENYLISFDILADDWEVVG